MLLLSSDVSFLPCFDGLFLVSDEESLSSSVLVVVDLFLRDFLDEVVLSVAAVSASSLVVVVPVEEVLLSDEEAVVELLSEEPVLPVVLPVVEPDVLVELLLVELVVPVGPVSSGLAGGCSPSSGFTGGCSPLPGCPPGCPPGVLPLVVPVCAVAEPTLVSAAYSV